MPGSITIACVIALTGCGRVGFEAANASKADANTGLVAWYPMDDDPSAGAMLDMSPNHLDGVCTAGGCPVLASGMIGMAAEFDGMSQHVTVDDDGRLQQTTGFTVTAWVMYLGSSGTVLSKPLADGPGASWELAVDGISVRFYNTDDVDETWIASDEPVPLGAWSHVAMSWDGTIKRLYLDSTEVASGSKKTLFDATPLQIGSDQEDGVTNSYFRGRLDEVRIYDRALPPAEILQIYESR